MLVSKWKKEKWGGITFSGPLSAYQTFCKALVNPASPLPLPLPSEPDWRIFKNRSPLLSLMQLRLCGASAKKKKNTSVVSNDLLMRQQRTTATKTLSNTVLHPSGCQSASACTCCARKEKTICIISLVSTSENRAATSSGLSGMEGTWW